MTGRERPARPAFFGRRKGHRLRARGARLVAELLPRLRLPVEEGIADLTVFFPKGVSDIWLEIGFGGGESLVATALRERHVGIVGCEPFLNGVAKALAAIDEHGLDRVRLYDRDVVALLDALPDRSIGRAFVLYPDPWPKRRQRKRRLISDATLARLARIMRPGAELRVATDVDDYAAWVLARVLRSNDFAWTAGHADDWRKAWPEWQGTRYERKALREGRQPIYLTFARRERTPDHTR